jgi:hypothetical protein
LINYVNEWVTESIEFMSSSKLRAKCQNNMFVGDNKNGNLYMLKLNKDRTGIEFDNSQQSTGLSDRRVITTIASAVKPNYLFKTFVEE